MVRMGRAASVLAGAALTAFLVSGGVPASFADGFPTTCARFLSAPRAEAAENDWVWIRSDQKYGKFYAPSNVQIKSQINGVATCITAWIKTTYTPGGAQETIDNYGIAKQIPDAKMLSYSLARVEVFPQERKICYVQENFYDATEKVIWSRVYEPPKEYEINSQSFEEDYYVALVDQVFRHGERERKDAQDRWILLWKSEGAGNIVTEAMADTTTMRITNDMLVYWEWQETKNAQGSVLEAKFMKKSLDHAKGAERIVRGQIWSPEKEWQDMDITGRYAPIPEGSAAYPGLVRLRAWVKGYSFWLNRYRTDVPQTSGAKKT